jgi:hypothetical protein
MVHDWSKPVDGHPRLFDHSALELLTTAHPRVVVSVYSLLAVALLWSGVGAGLSASVVVRRAAAGIAVWTLTEYLMHRYAFHFVASHAGRRRSDTTSSITSRRRIDSSACRLPSGITCSARAAEANPHR